MCSSIGQENTQLLANTDLSTSEQWTLLSGCESRLYEIKQKFRSYSDVLRNPKPLIRTTTCRPFQAPQIPEVVPLLPKPFEQDEQDNKNPQTLVQIQRPPKKLTKPKSRNSPSEIDPFSTKRERTYLQIYQLKHSARTL